MENTSEIKENEEGQVTKQIMYDDFQPSYEWIDDSNGHILLVELPGFKMENVTLQFDSLGKITVSGVRRVTESRYKRFNQNFQMPDHSDVERISMEFDSGLLFVIMPKKETEIKDELQKGEENENKREDFDHENENDWMDEANVGMAEGNGVTMNVEALTIVLNQNPWILSISRFVGDMLMAVMLCSIVYMWTILMVVILSSVGYVWTIIIAFMAFSVGYALIQNVLQKISKNMRIILTVVVTFSIGYYMSYILRSIGD